MWFYRDDNGTAVNMAHVVSIKVVRRETLMDPFYRYYDNPEQSQISYKVTAYSVGGDPFVLATYDTEEAAKLCVRDICHQMNHPEEWRGGDHEV